ncbi:hypothetical protein ACFX16_045448 [Malus domestica]
MGVACPLTTECQIRRCGPHCTIHKSRHLRLQYVARRGSVVATHKAPDRVGISRVLEPWRKGGFGAADV